MEQILEKLEELPNWKEKMRSACKKNNLCTSIASNLTILKIKMLGDRFRRSYETLKDRASTFWIENQLRAFTWIAIAISALNSRSILQFKEEQWNELRTIFYTKKLTYLKFEARKLVESKSKKNINWTLQQEKILTELVIASSKTIKDSQKIQWNEIAHKMFCISEERIFRNGKHCRQHWLNYLDPNKQRGAWTSDQDLYLTQKVIDQGKKWSEYAAHLKRTEHTVKNRFNSLIIKQKKLSPQIKKQQKLFKQLYLRLLSQIDKKIQKQQNSVQQQNQSQEAKDSDQSQNLQKIKKKENILEQKYEEQNIARREISKQEHISERVEVVQEQIQQKTEQIEVINPLSNYPPTLPPNTCNMSDLNFCIKEERQTNRTIFNEYPLFSPYSSYIISPNTPSNYLSPAQVFVGNNNFFNYYHMFMNITEVRQAVEKDKEEPNQ